MERSQSLWAKIMSFALLVPYRYESKGQVVPRLAKQTARQHHMNFPVGQQQGLDLLEHWHAL